MTSDKKNSDFSEFLMNSSLVLEHVAHYSTCAAKMHFGLRI